MFVIASGSFPSTIAELTCPSESAYPQVTNTNCRIGIKLCNENNADFGKIQFTDLVSYWDSGFKWTNQSYGYWSTSNKVYVRWTHVLLTVTGGLGATLSGFYFYNTFTRMDSGSLPTISPMIYFSHPTTGATVKWIMKIDWSVDGTTTDASMLAQMEAVNG